MQSTKTPILAPYGSLKSVVISSKVGGDGKVTSPALDQRQVVRRKKAQ